MTSSTEKNSLCILFAASALVLNIRALHLAKPDPEGGPIIFESGPDVFIRNDEHDKGPPKNRIMVWGSDLEFDIDDVTPRYHHIAKTGITSIIKLLKAGLVQMQKVNAYPANMGAFHKTKKDFYIGSIRNPCNYYISLWSYNVEKKVGQVRKELSEEKDGEHYFNVSETKDTDKDIGLFREFVKHIQGEMGVYTGRVAWGYVPEIGLGTNFTTRGLSHETCEDAKKQLKGFDESQVDCWVATETLTDDMGVCLKMLADHYEWPVNWTSYNKELETLSTNPSVHGKCKKYYDEPTEKFIRDRDDLIFDKFRFDECCDAGTNLAAHLKHPDVHPNI